MRYSILLAFLILTSFAQAQEYYVKLKGGTEIQAKSVEHKTPAFSSEYILVDKEKKYNIDSVAAYSNKYGEFIKARTKYKRGFYKKELQGRINTYSSEVTTYNPGMMGPNGAMTPSTFSSNKIEYYTKQGSSFKDINYSNLLIDLSDNLESIRKLQEVRKINRINTFLYLGAAATFIGGIIHTSGKAKDNESLPPSQRDVSLSPLLFAGPVIAVIPLMTKSTKQRKLNEAIKIYNE